MLSGYITLPNPVANLYNLSDGNEWAKFLIFRAFNIQFESISLYKDDRSQAI